MYGGFGMFSSPTTDTRHSFGTIQRTIPRTQR